MPKDVVITPASGLIDFQGNTGVSSATIQLDNSGNLNIGNPSGNLTLGDTSRDVYIGDGINTVDLVFEQNGEIRALSGKTLSIGQTDSYVNVISDITGTVNIGSKIDIKPYDTLNNGTLSWEGSAGQLFSITNNLTSGSIFSVNDVSGIPSIDVDANGIVEIAPFGGNVGVGTTNPTSKLDVIGNSNFIGVVTATSLIPAETRFISIAEKLTRVNGNTVSLAYNASGTNIGLATNSSGNITLAVTGIPTTSDFDNHVLTFSVFVNQTGTARSCTAVTLNGFSATIRWAGGSLANAISGVTTTTGMDIYSFTGINTVGSASTTANYYVLGVVNGGYR